MKSYCTANSLSHYVVESCYKDEHPISNLQLQKMLYFLQVVYAKMTKGNEVLFCDDFYAWPYGPVIPAVYEEFSRYGGRVIEASFNEGSPCQDSEIMTFIDQGIVLLREKSPWSLVELSHAKGSPWDRVYSGGRGYKQRIPLELIVKEAKAS